MTNATTERFAHYFTSPSKPISGVSFAEECNDPDTCYPTDTGEDDFMEPKNPKQPSGIRGKHSTGILGVLKGGGCNDSTWFRVRHAFLGMVRVPALVTAG